MDNTTTIKLTDNYRNDTNRNRSTHPNRKQTIDNLISKAEKEIELMNEYRTAMISEVVTGKIKVTI
jgi:hypothetical protein